MTNSIFDTLELEAFKKGITPRTKESIAWFRRKAQAMFNSRSPSRSTLMNDPNLTLTQRPKGDGNMYMFFYDPKHKATLPYYDAFPLIFMTGPAKGGFYGLNLHYLPPVLRAKVLDSVLNGTGGVPSKYIKPMIKHYLFSHVRSRLARVESSEYEIAAFLPTADFKKANKSQVYRESRKKML